MARPGQLFSENQGGPWTPEVWRVGPDVLVDRAQGELFAVARELGEVLTDAGQRGSMAGANPSDSTERAEGTEDVTERGRAYTSAMDVPTEAGPGRRQLWEQTVRQIHDVD